MLIGTTDDGLDEESYYGGLPMTSPITWSPIRKVIRPIFWCQMTLWDGKLQLTVERIQFFLYLLYIKCRTMND
jgi:hypothetical protein